MLSCVLIAAGSGQALAQQAPVVELDVKQSSLAGVMLEGMSALLDTDGWPCLYTGGFEQQRSLSGNAVAINSSGTFLFDCQYGLLWDTTEPVASTQVYRHGGERFAVNSRGRTKSLGGRVQQRIAGLLLALMGGETSVLEKDFNYSLQSDETRAVVLSPRRATFAQHIERIVIVHLDDSIDITISSPASAVTRIRLLQMRTQTLPAVAVCAQQSLQAAVTCPLLFNAVR